MIRGSKTRKMENSGFYWWNLYPLNTLREIARGMLIRVDIMRMLSGHGDKTSILNGRLMNESEITATAPLFDN